MSLPSAAPSLSFPLTATSVTSHRTGKSYENSGEAIAVLQPARCSIKGKVQMLCREIVEGFTLLTVPFSKDLAQVIWVMILELIPMHRRPSWGRYGRLVPHRSPSFQPLPPQYGVSLAIPNRLFHLTVHISIVVCSWSVSFKVCLHMAIWKYLIVYICSTF